VPGVTWMPAENVDELAAKMEAFLASAP
jgi:hypothetical protein